MTLDNFSNHAKNPPVSRGMIVFLALLLLLQLRSDRPVSGDEGPWGGARGLRFISELRRTIRERAINPPSDRKLYTAAIAGMLASLNDRWSAYIPPVAIRRLSRQLEYHRTGGIGVQVRELHSGGLEVYFIFKGLPADKAGLKVGDVIVGVDGIDISTMNIQDSVELILGPIGTDLQLKLKRGDKTRMVIVRRAALPQMKPALFLSHDEGLAYLVIDLFAEGLERQIATEIRRMRTQGMRGLVIDLRWSPGGALAAGVAISDLFMVRGVIVTIEERDILAAAGNTRKIVYRAGPGNAGDFPLILLVNEITASAAELFAAAMQESGRALLIGGKTFGKGRVQVMLPLGNHAGAIKLTTGRYLTPQGHDVEGKGIEPDIKVDLNPRQVQAVRRALVAAQLGRDGVAALLKVDTQLQAAVEELRRELSGNAGRAGGAGTPAGP